MKYELLLNKPPKKREGMFTIMLTPSDIPTANGTNIWVTVLWMRIVQF